MAEKTSYQSSYFHPLFSNIYFVSLHKLYPAVSFTKMTATGIYDRKEHFAMKNIDKDTLGEALARNTLDEIPQAKSDAKEIVGLVKSSGRINGYQLSDGSTVSKEEGVALAKEGEIKGVGIAHRKDTEYLKSVPDGSENNNLGNLPSVSG